jgi:hypothetical protein
MNRLQRLAKMLGCQMMDLVKDGESEPLKRARQKDPRADCLNHSDRHVKLGPNVASFPLNTTDMNPRQESYQFFGPLVCEKLLMNDNQEAFAYFTSRCNARKCLAVATGQTDNPTGCDTKGGECLYLMRA